MAEAKYNEKMTAAPSIEEKEIYVAITTDGFIYSRDSLELKEGSRKSTNKWHFIVGGSGYCKAVN